jgi:mRNA-degrading endonuclease toxin of MazEF toxin-antitoxin module
MANSHFKDFDQWSIQKKSINARCNIPMFFAQRDIWWVSVGINIQNEIDGKAGNFSRPVLVIRRINKFIFIGAPMTTNLKCRLGQYRVRFMERDVSILISQIRAYSTTRMLSKMGRIDIKQFKRIQSEARELIFPLLSQRGDKVDY